ncbi:glycosyltransferase family 2 protein [Sphaerisporangium rhizosphaerae]|uniref:Glucosyl-3-phosphoglycerate synthase n=1 Tax=Sphaerisporangium rhizosphaerae TaxID=2269375 RepID=A0ABW2PB59_9ACTN
MSRSPIDPALGLNLTRRRTLSGRDGPVSVVIPAHNEEATIAEVVNAAYAGLRVLGAVGEVIVSASGCSDGTVAMAARASARVIESPLGKGNAIRAGVEAADGKIVCLVDGDLLYYGDPPLVALLVAPLLQGTADATIADLYWRPLYPQLWLYGFFAPLAGRLFPELLPKAGTTPWSGQRAAPRELWPPALPDDFTADLSILLHWNDTGARLRPVVADDWVNPQRPKPDLMEQEFSVVIRHAVKRGRLPENEVPAFERWFATAHELMAGYQPEYDDPQQFETGILESSMKELNAQLGLS